MFDQMKSKTQGVRNADHPATSINLIGAGTSIEGEVNSNGDIRVDGSITGGVHSKAKVVVGSTGLVEGNVTCQNADISGTVKGNITVTETLFLKSSAKIEGDIYTAKLVVEVGASFTGNCNMGPLVKDMKLGEKSGELNGHKEKAAMPFSNAK
jgi:cytoskeletal protein CcmA (bactofilin family)